MLLLSLVLVILFRTETSEHWEHHLHSFTCSIVFDTSSFKCLFNDPSPPNSCGPSGQNTATSDVRSNPIHTIVSQGHVHPSMSTGHVSSHGKSHGPSHGPSYGSNYGDSHIPSYRPYYKKNYQSYGYGYQKPAYSPNYGFVAPQPQDTLHCNASM